MSSGLSVPGLIMRCGLRGFLPDISLWENGPGASFYVGTEQVTPSLAVHLTASRAALDSAPHVGLGCHTLRR